MKCLRFTVFTSGFPGLFLWSQKGWWLRWWPAARWELRLSSLKPLNYQMYVEKERSLWCLLQREITHCHELGILDDKLKIWFVVLVLILVMWANIQWWKHELTYVLFCGCFWVFIALEPKQIAHQWGHVWCLIMVVNVKGRTFSLGHAWPSLIKMGSPPCSAWLKVPANCWKISIDWGTSFALRWKLLLK